MTKIRNSSTIINTDYNYAKMIDRSMTEAIIPANINTIGAQAFVGFTSLVKAYIPKNIKTIANSAFNGCSKLKDLIFEDGGVTAIGSEAFTNCSALREMILPESLTSITYRACVSCTALEKIIFPKTLTEFANNGNQFTNATNLKYVFFKGNNPIKSPGGWGVFLNCNTMRLFDMRHMLSAKDKSSANSFTANNVYLYINVPDNLYNEFIVLPNWSALNLKRWVHSCDVETFDDIVNPQEGHYYSLKNDKNYLNPLGEKQIDIRQYTNGSWVEIDIG